MKMYSLRIMSFSVCMCVYVCVRITFTYLLSHSLTPLTPTTNSCD